MAQPVPVIFSEALNVSGENTSLYPVPLLSIRVADFISPRGCCACGPCWNAVLAEDRACTNTSRCPRAISSALLSVSR